MFDKLEDLRIRLDEILNANSIRRNLERTSGTGCGK